MVSTVARSHHLHAPSPSVRFGHLVAALVNGVLLWVTHQLLGWGWPGFLTGEFEELLGMVTFSFVVSIALETAYAFHDGQLFRGLGDLTTALVGLAVVVRTWAVFPFDFTGYATDWGWLARVVLVIGAFGTVAGAISALVKMIEAAAEPGGAS